MSARTASVPAASFFRLPILRSVPYTPAHGDNLFRTYLPAQTLLLGRMASDECRTERPECNPTLDLANRTRNGTFSRGAE